MHNKAYTFIFYLYFLHKIGAASGIALGVLLFFGFEPFSTLFTTDPAVLHIARSGVLVRLYFSYMLNLHTFVLNTNVGICSLSLYLNQLMPLRL